MQHTQLSRQKHLGHFALRATTAGSQKVEKRQGEASHGPLWSSPSQVLSLSLGGSLRP